VTAAELGAIALQELDLRLAEHEGGIAGGLLQLQQALGSCLQIVSQPAAAAINDQKTAILSDNN
jgi:hypothetical protein